MGLHYSKKLIEIHNGKIWLESKPNVGSEFFISIPLNLQENISVKKEYRILFLGLDNAGKTTLMNMITKKKKIERYTPSLDRVSNKVTILNADFIFIDVPGKERSRINWVKEYELANIVFFVIDINNPQRFKEAKMEFLRLISEPILKNTQKYILFNKIDLIDNRQVSDIIKEFKESPLEPYLTPFYISSLDPEITITLMDWIKKKIVH